MAERLMEMHGFSKLSLSALSTSSTPPACPLLQLEIGLIKMADDISSLQKQTLSPSSQSRPKPSIPHVQSAHSARFITSATCWYHTTFDDKACHCISPCSFASKQSKRVKRVSPKAVNTSLITTFGTCSLSLDIGFRLLFPWVFVVADIPCAILGADFLAALDLLVDCRHPRLHDKTTNLTIRGISSSDVSRQLAVLDPEPENPFQKLCWIVSTRFSHVHLDIAGLLPLSNGCSYLLTYVDRFTQWPEAIPLPDIVVPTVVKAFISRWVTIFGAPSTITTDRGVQFESNHFQSLLSFLGCTRIRMTAYHPAANRMVERFHRQPKASLRTAADPENWTDHLPLVLLGIRSALNPDLDCSAVELVFGATVRLPREMISPTPRGAAEDPTNFLHRLRQFTQTLSPVHPRSSASPSYLEDLATCSHVCLRCDRVRRPLEPPYDGPFRVLSRGPKTFRIQRDSREEVGSVDRLKTAVPDTPPGEPCDPLPSVPPPAASILPSRIFPLPSCPLPPTATTNSNTSVTRSSAISGHGEFLSHGMGILSHCTDTILPLTSLLSGLKAEMAAKQRRVGSPCDEEVSGLQLQDLPLTTGNGTILCNVSTISHRPFVSPSLRRKVSSSLHNLSHPGSRATDKLVFDRFDWPGIHKDLKAWTLACLGCQRRKAQLLNKGLSAPSPLRMHGSVMATWISYASCLCPMAVLTSSSASIDSLGSTRIRTTSYHPAANGMFERFHRQLMASLRTADDPESWTNHLPLVLFGIQSSLKSDHDCFAAELVFGATIRLPGQMISSTSRVAAEDPTNLLHRLRQLDARASELKSVEWTQVSASGIR
ncbi:hypothetical protein SprV_0100181700 [Sparganum proliferum]